jgi:hypothetical protein
VTAYSSIDDLLRGTDASELRAKFSGWRAAISSRHFGEIKALDTEGRVGVRLDLPRGFHRFLPAWLLSHVLESKARGSVAISGDSGDFRTLAQFVDVGPARELFAVAHGPDATQILQGIVAAAATFDPSRFDSDGYLK